jgi:anti-sigma regulatory factor (Ser/Thr protein kinase)
VSVLTDNCDVEMCIVSDPRYLCVVRAAVSAAIQRFGFDEDESGKVILAVDEAVTNVMRHGYDNADDQPIWVYVRPTDHRGRAGVTILVEDRARQVEPENIRGRELADVRPGGLGVHIIREVMDEVQYTKRSGGGMRLLMAKSADAEPLQTPKQESSTS